MTPIPYPNITGEDPREQLEKLRKYLIQLADQLNYTLEQLERSRNDTETKKL